MIQSAWEHSLSSNQVLLDDFYSISTPQRLQDTFGEFLLEQRRACPHVCLLNISASNEHATRNVRAQWISTQRITSVKLSSHPDTVTGSNGSNCIVFSRALSNSLALFSCLCSLIFSLVELSPPNKCPLLFMQVWPRDPSHTPSSKQWCSVPHSQKLQLGRLFSTVLCSYRGYTAFGHWCTSRSWVDCFFI